jgi:hypothetical protein
MSHLTSNPFGQSPLRSDARFIPYAHASELEASLVELLECEELDQLDAIAERSWIDEPQAAPVRALEMAAEAHIAG